MKETQHTPGKWFAIVDKDKFYPPSWEIKVFSDVNGRTLIADLTGAATHLNCNDEFAANAELIASAPSLLKENQELKALNTELVQALEHAIEMMESELRHQHYTEQQIAENEGLQACKTALINPKDNRFKH